MMAVSWCKVLPNIVDSVRPYQPWPQQDIFQNTWHSESEAGDVYKFLYVVEASTVNILWQDSHSVERRFMSVCRQKAAEARETLISLSTPPLLFQLCY